ncbi:hypothetical protein ACF0H5_016736 [Mactra antiquata]
MSIEKKNLEKVQTIGKEMVHVVNQIQGTNEQHYMVAYLVSERELKTGKTCIEHLHSIQTHFRDMVREGNVNLSEKCQILGRFIFFMNLYDFNSGWSYKHTEKRLFDFLDTQLNAGDCGLFPYGYPVPMLPGLWRRRGSEWAGYRLLIFTYYIPCTNSQHQCAKLINRYAEITGCKMTIGWVKCYKSTNIEESIKEMNSENIDIVKLNELEPNVVSSPLNGPHGSFQWRTGRIFLCHSGAFSNGSHERYHLRPWFYISPQHAVPFLNGQHANFQSKPLYMRSPPQAGAFVYGPNERFY